MKEIISSVAMYCIFLKVMYNVTLWWLFQIEWFFFSVSGIIPDFIYFFHKYLKVIYLDNFWTHDEPSEIGTEPI